MLENQTNNSASGRFTEQMMWDFHDDISKQITSKIILRTASMLLW